MKPRLGLYVQSLGMHCWALITRYGCEGLVSDQSWSPQCDFLPLFKTAIESAGIIGASDIDNEIQHGLDYQLILALLLHHLPNLEVLDISLGTSIEHLSKTIRSIKDAPVGTYVSHLKSVSVNFNHVYERRHSVASFIAFLISLPSLTSCHMTGLVLRSEERDLERHLRPRESHVSDLNFTSCNVGGKALLKILESITCLRSLACTNLQFLPAEEPNPWYELYLSLAGSSNSSLEKLTLTDCLGEYLENNNWNFHEFEVLQEIKINLNLILNASEPSVKECLKILPPSLRTMRLRLTPTSPDSEEAAYEWFRRIREAILSVLETKNVLLPQLKEFHMGLVQGGPESVFEDLSTTCHAQGVSFTLWYPEFLEF